MARVLYLLYGVVVYILFVGTFLYLVGFVENTHIRLAGDLYLVPKSIDFGGPYSHWAVALVIDLALLTLFAVQHSVMARRRFKELWTRVVPAPIERSTYVLFASLCLVVLFAFWRPMIHVVWAVENTALIRIIQGLSLGGFAIALVATFLISHPDLFGLRQVVLHLRGKQAAATGLVTPGLYKFVRHPIYLGFTLAFWAAPVMTTGRLLFAGGTLAYILLAIRLEERDLVRDHGEDYLEYRRRVGMLLPLKRGR
jgi:methanethiol S-methyltransferase